LFNVSLDTAGLKLCTRHPYGIRAFGKHPCEIYLDVNRSKVAILPNFQLRIIKFSTVTSFRICISSFMHINEYKKGRDINFELQLVF